VQPLSICRLPKSPRQFTQFPFQPSAAAGIPRIRKFLAAFLPPSQRTQRGAIHAKRAIKHSPQIVFFVGFRYNSGGVIES